MNTPTTEWLVHVGPLRLESTVLLKYVALPSLVITPSSERPTIEGMHSTMKHISAWVAPQAGEAKHYHYNLPGFDGFAPATGLKRLYPGAFETERRLVETKPLVELINVHGVDSGEITQLVLEQPEQALSLLKAWQSESLLDSLEVLYVRTSPISLYEGMPTQQELLSWCSKHGFEEDVVAEAEDPEFFLQCFKRNTLYVPLKVAESQIEELKKENEQLHGFLAKEKEIKQETQGKLEKNHQWFLSRKQEAEEKKEQLKALQSEFYAFKEKYDHLAELADERQQQVHELQRQNKKLKTCNQQLSDRQAQLQNELIKTEAHVELIKELMING